MNISENEVESKKRVGNLNGRPVVEVGLRGGLWLIFANVAGKFETIGAGPHRAVARHIAKKRTEGKVEFTDLSKADYIEPEHFEWLLPLYEAETDRYAARFSELDLG